MGCDIAYRVARELQLMLMLRKAGVCSEGDALVSNATSRCHVSTRRLTKILGVTAYDRRQEKMQYRQSGRNNWTGSPLEAALRHPSRYHLSEMVRPEVTRVSFR